MTSNSYATRHLKIRDDLYMKTTRLYLSRISLLQMRFSQKITKMRATGTSTGFGTNIKDPMDVRNDSQQGDLP